MDEPSLNHVDDNVTVPLTATTKSTWVDCLLSGCRNISCNRQAVPEFQLTLSAESNFGLVAIEEVALWLGMARSLGFPSPAASSSLRPNLGLLLRGLLFLELSVRSLIGGSRPRS